MSAQYSLDELEKELARREGVVSSGSVLQPEGSTLDEFKKAATSVLKGSVAGILDVVGGWGNLYDYLKGKTNTDPSTLSSQGLKEAVKGLTGVNVQSIDGYKGAYTVGRTGAPAAALSAAGIPGLFGRTAAGLAGEFGVAGGTGLLAESIAPNSPLAQLAIQSSPYAVKGLLGTARSAVTKPSGELRPNVDELLQVGPLTPGEATGSRVQLAKEAKTEASPQIESKGEAFRQAQSQSVESYLSNLFDRASGGATADPTAITQKVTTSLDNYSRTLSSKLKTDAGRDFRQAKASGGLIDTTPVIDVVKAKIDQIAPEVAGLQGLRSQLGRILDEFYIEAKPATTSQSLIVDASGAPAMTTTTPAVPAGAKQISIDRLQQNLSAWGEAAYTGKFDVGGANILDGVAPGQAKGIARAVLQGYKNALDNAIQEGVPGAGKLMKARDNFAANLRQIEEFADKPFVKAFGKTANELVPEQVATRLSNATPSQRAVMVQLLGSDAPEVLQNIRRIQFNNVLSKAEVAGAAADAPTFSIERALTEMDKKKGDFGFLFTSDTDRQAAIQAMQYMRTVLKNAGGEVGGVKPGEIYSATRGLGGTSSTGNLLKVLGDLVKDVVANPNVMADVIFDKNTVEKLVAAKKQPRSEKIFDAVTALGKNTAVQGLRAGPRMGDTGVEDGSKIPVQSENDYTIQQLEEELRRREAVPAQ